MEPPSALVSPRLSITIKKCQKGVSKEVPGCLVYKILHFHCRGHGFKSWSRHQDPTRHAAAAAKSLQLCPTLCDPTDSSPPGSPVPGILQARTLEWARCGQKKFFNLKIKKKKNEEEG